jgi:hypothetical protein
MRSPSGVRAGVKIHALYLAARRVRQIVRPEEILDADGA